jgi:hypothetical protein
LRITPTLKEHVEDLALVVDGGPQIHPFPGDPNDHLVEVPSSARAWAALPQLARDSNPYGGPACPGHGRLAEAVGAIGNTGSVRLVRWLYILIPPFRTSTTSTGRQGVVPWVEQEEEAAIS